MFRHGLGLILLLLCILGKPASSRGQEAGDGKPAEKTCQPGQLARLRSL